MLSVLLAGCFSDPPAQGSGSTSEDATSAADSTGVSSSSGADETSAEGTTTGVGSSSSGTGMSDTSSTEGTGSSTGFSGGCRENEVQVGSLCLVPLDVESVVTDTEPDGFAPLDGESCLVATCSDGSALGGGFLLQGALAYGSHREAGGDAWRVCGDAEPEATPNAWQSFARCAVGGGDVLVNTETYELDGGEGLNCFESLCPAGTTLVGGGGRWGPTFGFLGSEPADLATGMQWQVCGVGGGAASVVEVDAYCAVLPGGMTVGMYEEVQPIQPGDSGCAESSCPGGMMLGGGVGGAVTSTVLASYPTADRWVACGRPDFASAVNVRSRVLCLEG